MTNAVTRQERYGLPTDASDYVTVRGSPKRGIDISSMDTHLRTFFARTHRGDH